MKLVEILARELKEWPEDGGPVVAVVQDPDMMAYVRPHDDADEFAFRQNEWIGVWHNAATARPLSELATDHATAIVTRPQWQAEKARIAGKETWLRHRGRKCPVQSGTLVDLKLRGGVIHRGKFCDNHAWIHTGKPFDVMYYRISETDEQLVPKPCADPVPAVLVNPPDGPFEWRDRIHALDTQRAELEATYQRQIREIDGEREGLVERLAGEGLALVELANVADPDFDAEDKSTWRVCDVVEIVSSDNRCWLTRKGMRGQLNYDSAMYLGGWYIKFDDAGDWCVSDNTELKFHSRNAS